VKVRVNRRQILIGTDYQGLYRISAFSRVTAGVENKGNISPVLLQLPHDKSDRRSGVFDFTDGCGQGV
jgi:hypothetical protein